VACRASFALVAAAMIACGGNTKNASESSAEQPATHGSTEHTEGLIVLDSAAVRLGGIVTAKAEAYTATGLPVTGAITYDANRVSHIGARTQGRVVTLRAELGARVR
jgi:hypothetical protein